MTPEKTAARKKTTVSRPTTKRANKRPAKVEKEPMLAETAAAAPMMTNAMEATTTGAPGTSSLTLRSSKQFWLWLAGGVLLVAALIQGYGYLTGWGNPQRVIQRYFDKAQKLTMAQRYPAAIGQYQKVLDMNTDQETTRQALIGIADLYFRMQKWEQAMQSYQQLKELDPKSVIAAWAALKIAECQLGNNRIEDAIQTYFGVTQEYPGTDWYAEARMGLGVAYEKKKDYDVALEHYHYIVQHYSGGFLAAEALVNMGQCFLQKGNEAKAKQLYEQVVAEYHEAMIDDAKNRLEALKQGKTGAQSRPWGN